MQLDASVGVASLWHRLPHSRLFFRDRLPHSRLFLRDRLPHSRLFLRDRLPHSRLFLAIAYPIVVCFFAIALHRTHVETGTHEILAVARLSKLHGRNEAEFALLVSDRYQCQGLGTELLQRLIQVGWDEGIELITAEILSENSGMRRVCEKLGFQIQRAIDSNIVKAEIRPLDSV